MTQGTSYSNALNELNEGIHIFDTEAERNIDFHQLLVAEMYAESLLPEVFEVIGSEKFARFLDTFEGMTLKIPTREQREKIRREMDIYFTLKRTQKGHRGSMVQSLSDRYQIPTGDVRKSFIETEERMSKYRMKIGV